MSNCLLNSILNYSEGVANNSLIRLDSLTATLNLEMSYFSSYFQRIRKNKITSSARESTNTINLMKSPWELENNKN